MNPDCKSPQLISDDKQTSYAEIAHITPHSQGGDISFDNLILLCRNCHKANEPIERPAAKTTLRNWKNDRRNLLTKIFASRFDTFAKLSENAVPILQDNYHIFTTYGPQTDDQEAFKIWQIFEPQLIANNSKLKLLFKNNLNLFADNGKYNNRTAITYFIHHVDEFCETRNGFDGVRKILFPWRILSIFGICEEPYSNEQSINAIQNLIGKLLARGFKVNIDLLDSRPQITIGRNGNDNTIFLDDNPRVEQILFTENARECHTTDMRLDNLQFTLRAIKNVGACVKFNDLSNLTIITINDRIKVKLFYSYALSVADLQSTNLTNVSYAANLHNWNGAPITKTARDFAAAINVKVMTFNQLIQFCREGLL